MNATGNRPDERGSQRRPYPHEMLTAGYLAATGALAAVLGQLTDIWPTILAHAVGIIVILAVLPRIPQRRWVVALRDWGLVLVLPFLYVEVSHLNRLLTSGYHDRAIQYLHFSYVAYYALLPLLGGALYFTGRRREYRYVLATVLGTFYVCYLCFILYPVAGPWYRSPHPDAASLGHFFPSVVHAVLVRAASKGAAFPSSHVAVAVVIWLLAWRFARRVFWILAAIVPALALGTVYGGFHYAVDAGAGLVVGVAGYLAAPHVHRLLGGGDMPEPGLGGIEG